MKPKTSWWVKLPILIFSFVASSLIYWNVTSIDSGKSPEDSATEGVYVLEGIEIDYRYDKTKYEVVSLTTEPYVVIRGNKALINKMKWSKKDPNFYIDLTGKTPGEYQEKLYFDGIDPNLTVEVYPTQIGLNLMEQQTLKYVPQIELQNDSKNKDYIVAQPELLQQEVRVRDTSVNLNNIGSIRGTVDVSKLKKTEVIDVKLQVYDRDNNLMPDVNLLEPVVKVRVPVEKRVTVIQENVIQEIVVQKEPSTPNPDTKPQTPQTPQQPQEPKPPVDKPETPITPPSENQPLKGVLTFLNVADNLVLENLTPDLKWTTDVTVDLKNFVAGFYEMPIRDEKGYRTLKFKLIQKETQPPPTTNKPEHPEEPTQPETPNPPTDPNPDEPDHPKLPDNDENSNSDDEDLHPQGTSNPQSDKKYKGV